MLRRTHANVLLAGAQIAVNIALDALQDSLQQPVVMGHAGDLRVLPSLASSGTVILQDVDGLSQKDQQRLLNWLDEFMGKMQVVSTTRAPLFRLVERGVFLDTLYYRLNVVFLEVAS